MTPDLVHREDRTVTRSGPLSIFQMSVNIKNVTVGLRANCRILCQPETREIGEIIFDMSRWLKNKSKSGMPFSSYVKAVITGVIEHS